MSGRAANKLRKPSAAIFSGGDMLTRKPTRKERLADELAATTLITAERRAAVSLSDKYNWIEWTAIEDNAAPTP
jgi:hypothetical protein